MKMLKLTNTTECLKLAECLIGSRIITNEGTSSLVAVVDSSFVRAPVSFNESFRGNCSVDSIIIPSLTAKLNPYKCCEHSIPVIVDRGYFGKEKRNKRSEMLSILAKGCPFELDLDRLPNGAELITQGE